VFRRITSLILLAASAAVAVAQSRDPIVGTWRIVRYEIWQNGTVTQPLGRKPGGYVVFDATGHAFVQITFGTDTAVSATVRAGFFGAYFGPYSVRRTRDSASLAIRVEGTNDPTLVGTTQHRPFVIRRDSLILGVPGDYRATFTRVPAAKR
jgi:lipocalin-like protein